MKYHSCEEDQGDVNVDFDLNDNDLDSVIAKMIPNLQNKTAQLLHRAVGDSGDVTELKENKQKGKKPSQHNIQQYKTLTAKLHLRVCLVRRKIKSQLAGFEYKQHGSFPDCSKNSEYNTLRKKYDFVRILISVCNGLMFICIRPLPFHHLPLTFSSSNYFVLTHRCIFTATVDREIFAIKKFSPVA